MHTFRKRAFVSLLLLSVLLAAGCAARQPLTAVDPVPSAPPVAPESPGPAPSLPRYDELYAEIDDARRLYGKGVELLAMGEEIAGELRIAEASNRLEVAADTCWLSDGCDMGAVVDALQRLLDLQARALNQKSYEIETLEASIADFEDAEPGSSVFHAELPEVERTHALLRGTDLREIIRLNGPVKAALDDWLTWLRPTLIEAHENYQFLREEIAPIYEQAGLPEALLFAMIATESGGKVHAFSRAGAAGPLQFMRYTGRIYGLKVEDGFDTRLDPVAATRANVAYLNDRFKELNDSLAKALAAYNGGEGRLRSLNRRLKGAPLWDKRMFYALPRETREYVPRILAAAWLFMHPEEYQLELPRWDVTKTELTLAHDSALGELAVCLGPALGRTHGWFRTLRNLNPRLEPGDRVPAGETILFPRALVDAYHERCIDGAIVATARELHDANYPDGPELVPYVVRRGDTLGKIASRFRCVSIAELADINRIRAPRYVIHVGQELKIPTCG